MKFQVRWSEPKKLQEGNFKISADGVYLIGYRDEQTGKRYILYVGQGDIGTRLADHHWNNSRIQKRIGQVGRVGYYRYAECADEGDRLDIELGLYHQHGGKKLCNEIEPSGSGRYWQINVEEQFL
jgi:hypothetical protein